MAVTVQEQYTRALKGQHTAREALRNHPGNDTNVDHWAERLVFWRNEAKRLQNIANEEGHGLSEVS